jgi:hypothetical protein
MLHVIYAECQKKALYAEFRNAECRYAECRCAKCRCAECRNAECLCAYMCTLNP